MWLNARGGLAATLLLLSGLLLAGCTPGSEATAPVEPTVPEGRCSGVTYDDVRGPVPDLARPPLRELAVDPAVCAAYWLDRVDDGFVVQALEVDGDTAYVGGYRWARKGRKACQVAVLDLRSAEVTRFVDRIDQPGGPESAYCRHGGGLELTREGLWMAGANKIWLLDPDRLGTDQQVLRVWRVEPPVKGSTVVVHDGRLGMALYANPGPGTVWWFTLDKVMARGVDTLAVPVATGRAPARVQGVTTGPGGLWYAASNTHCAELHGPDARRVGFVPGAEDFAFEGPDIWVVSEAGVAAYLDEDELVVPQLLRLDREQVLAGEPATCGF